MPTNRIIEKAQIENAIWVHCASLGMKSSDRYVATNEDNLIQIFSNWDEIKAEISTGQGNEFKWDGDTPPKFNALHSSSALGVNTFAPFKEHIGKFSFYSYSDFTEGTFEKKLPTGISRPNLDFYLESNCNVIGIESKFTEILSPKLPNSIKKGETKGNLEKYLQRGKLDFIPDRFEQDIIQYYKDFSEKMHLDVAQLIKHIIGLFNKVRTNNSSIFNQIHKSPVLIYIYWQPINWYDFDIYRCHEQEIDDFKARVSRFIHFIPISYLEFWKIYERAPLFANHLEKVKNRYCLKA